MCSKCRLYHGLDSKSSPGTESSVLIAARGYVPARLPATSLPWNAQDPDLEVRLHPARQRTLSVVDDIGAAVRLPVAMYSPAHDVLCWSSTGSKSGFHGPFDWFGGDLYVRVGEGRDFPLKLAEAELAASDVVRLIVPIPTGSIVVENVPETADGARLIAKLGAGRSGTTHVPSSLRPGAVRFDRLPVGHYCVGPATWVEGAERQSLEEEKQTMRLLPRPSRVVVTAGSETTIAWSDVWEAGTELSGRITSTGAAPTELFVVPLYGDERTRKDDAAGAPPRLVFGRRSPRIPLDLDGGYSIGPHDPLPLLLVVCALDDAVWGSVQGLHVLDTLLPGESIDIATAPIELVDVGPARSVAIEVQYRVPVDALRHPVSTFYEWSKTSWTPGTVLRLDQVPLHVRELHIGGSVLGVQLRSGVVERKEVDVRNLQTAPR